MRHRVAAHVALLLCVASVLAGCGDDEKKKGSEKDPDQDAFSAAADLTTCRDAATEVAAPYGEGFPEAFPFPPDTTVYNVEERGSEGTIVTGVSSGSFQVILDFLNKDAVDAGFKVTEGETEEHDAEANWAAEDYTGRWAIRESATCPGETVVQVAAVPKS